MKGNNYISKSVKELVQIFLQLFGGFEEKSYNCKQV
jgi:hypothetical protein